MDENLNSDIEGVETDSPVQVQDDQISNVIEPEEPVTDNVESEKTPLIEDNSSKALLEPPKKSRKKLIIFLILFTTLLIIAGCLYYVFVINKPSKKVANNTPVATFSSKFATYTETPVNIQPAVKAFSINSNFSNITNFSDFDNQYMLPANAKDLLLKNSFVVTPGYSDEFFTIYESNRGVYTPSFITTDSILHNYHLLFNYMLEKLEKEQLATELKTLNANMLAESISQYESLKGSEWENAAKRNVGFFAVGSKIMDSSVTVPAYIKSEVNQELAYIEAHEKIIESPIMNIGTTKGATLNDLSLEQLKEDYTQYIPRGHYDKTDQLKAYFKAMMWYGRLTFRLKVDDEIKSGLLISIGLNKEANQSSWNKIYEPINFFVGKSDDITYYQFKDIVSKVYGSNVTTDTIKNDSAKFTTFVADAKKLESPQINSIPIFNAEIQPDRDKEIKGFRFMGQRFTIDSSVFQRLIDREVPNRLLPKGLDIPAAFGSTEALNILTSMGETNFKNYSENMTSMKSYISKLPTSTWTQNLYWGWLYTLKPLTDEKLTGYPTFMQNTAWKRKDLNTFLGSWTELKHDTILYAKQVYAEMGSAMPEEKDDRGYVEPNPYLYARLASLIGMTESGLDSRGLLSTSMKDNLGKMKQLSLSLKTISEKELNNTALTDAEYELIRSYGGQLEHFWLEVNKDEEAYKNSTGQQDYLNENPAALVADVATDPNGTVLEEATGNISNIYVVISIDGKLKIAKGGVYSYYEFTKPMSERLTDKQWRELLSSEQKPELPSWTSEFMSQ